LQKLAPSPASFAGRTKEWLDTRTAPAEAWIERNPALVFGIYSVLYFMHVFGVSPHKLFWNDEYLSYWTSQLPDFSAIWRSLREAPLPVDPPLYHFATHLLCSLHVPRELAVRLPSMIGFWLMLFSVFVFVRRRANTLVALFASSVILASPAQLFAVEARPYGLFAGCVAFALLCWQTASMRETRRFWPLLGMGVGIGAALLSHYYAAISVSAIVGGEVVRLWTRRHVDRAMWLGLLAPFLTIAFYVPLLPAASIYRGYAPSPVTITALLECYAMAASPVLLPALILAIVWPFFRRHIAGGQEAALPVWEAAAALFLFIAPVAGFAVGRLYTHAYGGRYTLPFIIGSAVLLGWGFHRSVANRLVGYGLLISLGTAVFSIKTGVVEFFQNAPSASAQITSLDPEAFRRYPSLPIAVSRSEIFYGAQLYGNPLWKNRCVAVVDAEAVRAGFRSFEAMAMVSLLEWTRKQWVALPIEDLPGFVQRNRQFLLWSDGWLSSLLQKQGARLEWLDQAESSPVFLVTLPK
jgi:4-amino-4-deoxy-L-arabinose transferase-like glycosyltransferase